MPGRFSNLRPLLAFLALLGLALSWSLGTLLLSAAVVRGEFAGPEHVWHFAHW